MLLRKAVLAALLVTAIAVIGGIAGGPRAEASHNPDDIVAQAFAEVSQGDSESGMALVTEDFHLTEIGVESFAIIGRAAFGVVIEESHRDHFTIEVDSISAEGNTVTGAAEFHDDFSDDAGIDRYREFFTAEVTDDHQISTIDLTFDTADEQTAKWLAFVKAQQDIEEGGDEEAEPGSFGFADLAAQPGGNQPGGAFLFAAGPGVVGVGVEIDPGPAGVLQPAHFHTGTCAAPGPIVHPIAFVLDGRSFAFVSADFSDVVDTGLIINVHKSQAEPGAYVACGEVLTFTGEEPPAAPSPAAPSPAATPRSGVTAPDTGTGTAAEGTLASWALALLLAGAAAFAAGGAMRITRQR